MTSRRQASVFAPATVANVGPGFDILGLAVEGLGDTVHAEITEGGEEDTVAVSGRDAEWVPAEARANVAAIAARAWMRKAGEPGSLRLRIEKGLPLSGGLGGSAASSVGGALAAALACGADAAAAEIIAAALVGEEAVAGRHLDNIVPCLVGGLVLVRSAAPLDFIRLPVREAWWLALVTPALRLSTRATRALLPDHWVRREWVQQMANTAALTHAFASGDAALLGRALDDRYAEPRRAALIPGFAAVKRAALASGALGCSISGSGPTVFAITADSRTAAICAAAMQREFGSLASSVHCGRIAERGAHPLPARGSLPRGETGNVP